MAWRPDNSGRNETKSLGLIEKPESEFQERKQNVRDEKES